MHRTELPAGVSNNAEFWMSFALWARKVGNRLTPEMIRMHFGVSRATSYRWMTAWEAARERI